MNDRPQSACTPAPGRQQGSSIVQRLNHDHTLQAEVCDLHAGGADRLASKKCSPPSELIRSLATSAFSKARKRSPLA